MAAEVNHDSLRQNGFSSSTRTSTMHGIQSNSGSTTSLASFARKKRLDPYNRDAFRRRAMETYPQPLQAADTETQCYDSKRLEKMLAAPTVPANPSVTSEPETEFDWKDYNFKKGQSTIDPSLLDSNSDLESWGPAAWDRRYSNKSSDKPIFGGSHDHRNSSSLYQYYTRENLSRGSSNSVKSSGHIIKPEQIRGILKAKAAAKDRSVTQTIANSDESLTKDSHDITESIAAFNQYLHQRAVRFKKSKSNRTKLRFLSRHQTVEKRAEWDRSLHAHNKHSRKHHEEEDGKLPPLKLTSGYQAIQEFEKRNVIRTCTKMGDVESLFLKDKQALSESCCSSSTEEEDDENETPISGYGSSKRNSVPTNSLDKKQYKTKRSRSLKGDEILIPTARRSSQFKLAVGKVQKMINKKRFSRTFSKAFEEKQLRIEKNLTPLERFRHAGRVVIMLLRAVGIKTVKPEDSDYNFLSWTIMYDELGISRLRYDDTGLSFDPQMFKANKESFLSADVRDILLTPPAARTDGQIQAVIRFLSQVVPAFGEYPLRIQRSTLKCCTFERFESGRVIIRQGHRAENFYFILSGTAVVTIMDSGVNHVHTVNILTSGNSFGELAFLNMSQRTATVTCRDAMELLCIERNDFIKIFMRRFKDKEPEHVTFLKNVDVLKGWPINKLPLDNLKICAFTYVRRGVTLCPDSSRSDWLFVVVSGTCKIIKALNDVDASLEKTSHSLIQGLSPFDQPSPRVIVSNSKSVKDITADKRYSSRKSRGDRQNNRCSSGIATVINRPEDEVKQSRSEHAMQLENIYHKRHVLPSIHQRQKKKHRHSKEDDKKNNSSNNNYFNHLGNYHSRRELREDEEDAADDDDRSLYFEDDSSTPKSNTPDGNLTPLSSCVTPLPQTPEIQITASTPSQFLRPATQNFGIHRRSPKPTADSLVPIDATRKAWRAKKRRKPKVFIEVARLEPGDVFGLEHVVMKDMEDVTSTSLVSDGAEVVIIEKKFFRKHLTEETAKRMRQTIRPVPSDSVLQQNLINQRHWDAYKSRTMESHARQSVQAKLNQAFRV